MPVWSGACTLMPTSHLHLLPFPRPQNSRDAVSVPLCKPELADSMERLEGLWTDSLACERSWRLGLQSVLVTVTRSSSPGT
jgi:hypothetical protein